MKQTKKTNSEQPQLLAGIDIGTAKVAACIGKINTSGDVEIIGIGTHPSTGVSRGMVVNIEATVEALRIAIKEAEAMANHSLTSAVVALGGDHIVGFNSQGSSAIRSSEVNTDELESALASAKAIPLSHDEQIIHVIPQEYVIDRQGGIREPLGMSGSKLDANVHLIKGSKNAVRNTLKCVKSCGVEIEDIVVKPLASASSVLAKDEQELGVCLLDIGGGTTDAAVYTDGAIRHTLVIPIAGDSVSRDIAMTFRTPAQSAEDLKIKYACALQALTNEKDTIHVRGVAGRPATEIPRQTLAAVVEPRYRELYECVNQSFKEIGFSKDRLGSGVIITGGAAAMEGAVELAEEVFHLPVSCGKPKNLQGLNDIHNNTSYSTCTGLLAYAIEKRHVSSLNEPEKTTVNKFSLKYISKWFKRTYDQI